MVHSRFSWVMLSFLVGCGAQTAETVPICGPDTSHSAAAEEDTTPPEKEETAQKPAPPPTAAKGREVLEPLPEFDPSDWVVHSLSYSAAVADPRQAVSETVTLLEQMGVRVVNSSSHDTYGHVNANFSPDMVQQLRQSLNKLNFQFTNENISQSDISTSVKQLHERLFRLKLGRRLLLDMMRRTDDEAKAEALSALLQSTENDQRSLESQLDSYRNQVEHNTLSISFSRIQPPTVHGYGHP